MLAAVFFDLDGVLLDSMAIWRAACFRGFAGVGIGLSDALYERCAGMDGAEGVRTVLAAHPGVAADARDVQRRIEDGVRQRLLGGVPAMAGAVDLLDALRERGTPLALVSTSPRELIDLAVRGLGLEGRFRVTLSSEEVGPGKPDPAVYREAMRRMGVSAGLAVEDTPAGVASAVGAGLDVLGVAADPTQHAALRAAGAAWVAPDLRVAAARVLVL